jgi:hypothetical protein
VQICVPDTPVVPKMVITSVDSVSRCSDIVLDASTSQGRGSNPWTALTWSVSSISNNPNLATIAADLNAVVSAQQGAKSTTVKFTVDNSRLLNGTYTFNLCATNMFGNSDCSAINVTVSDILGLPTVSLNGITSMFRYQALAIYGNAFVPGCDGSLAIYSGITYDFKLYNASDDQLQTFSSVASNSRNFKLNSLTLDVSTDYYITLTATRKGISATARHDFSVGKASMKAVITPGGSLLTVSEAGQKSFSGASSYDRDFPLVKTNLAYSWSCDHTCVFPSQRDIVFDATAQSIMPDEEYTLKLTVVNTLIGSSSADSAVVVVKVQAGLPFPDISFRNIKAKYNPDVRIILYVDIYTAYASSQADWSLFDRVGHEILLDGITSTPTSAQLSSGSTSLGLTMKANTFSVGGVYTFHLTAKYFLQGGEESETIGQVDIFINESPSGGNFLVSPDSGEALSDIYAFSASDWDDDIADYPIRYRFGFYVALESETVTVRDLATTSYADTLLSAGKSQDDSVTCVVWVADNLGLAASSEQVVTSSPIVITSVSQMLALFNSVQPDLVLAFYAALSDSLNLADCSAAPNCLSLNRHNCSYTAGTCGSCVDVYPIGVPGDSNTACIDSVRRSLSEEEHYSAAVTLFTPKACPDDCGGSTTGECVYTAWNGDVVFSCDELDTNCRATCECVSGWYSADCSRNITDFNVNVAGKDLLSNLTYGEFITADITESMIAYFARSVSNLLRDPTQVTDDAYNNCANLVIEMIDANAALAVLDSNYKTVVETLSVLLDRGQDMPDDIYDGVVQSIRKLNEARQLIMSPGEEAIQFYTKNLRYYAGVEYIGEFILETDWIVAQSALEKALGAVASSVLMSNQYALNNSIKNTVTIVGVGLWEILINTGQERGNSSHVSLETRVLSGPLGSVPASQVVVVLYNHEAINYKDVVATKGGTVDCYYSSDGLPYIVDVFCPQLESVTCPGTGNVYVHYTCPYEHETPTCSLWDPIAADYVNADQCTVVSYDNTSTTCSCDGGLDVTSSRRSLSVYDFENPQNYDFTSRKTVMSVAFDISFSAYIPYEFGTSDNVIVFIMTLAFTVIAVVGVLHLMSRSLGDGQGPADNEAMSKYSLDEKGAFGPGTSYTQVLNVAAHILCAEYGHSDFYQRYSRVLMEHSAYLSFFRWKMPFDETLNTELIEKWAVLAGYFLNFMFIHAIMAYVIYNDDGYCQDQLRPDVCESRNSQLSVYMSRCEWRYDGDQYCALRSPMSSTVGIFMLFLIASVVVVPLNCIWSVLVRHIMNRFVVSAQRGVKSFLIVAVDEASDDKFQSEKSKSQKTNCGKDGGKYIDEGQEQTKQYFKSTKGVSAICASVKKANDASGAVGLDIDIENEVIYVLHESRALVLTDDLDDMAMTSDAMHRAYVMRKLRMDRNGIVKGTGNSKASNAGNNLRDHKPYLSSSRDRVKTKIRRARHQASGIVSAMSSFKEEELMNSYLIEVFLLSCLPEALRYFAMKYFFTDKSFYSEWNEVGPINKFVKHFSVVLLPLYMMTALIVIVVLGFNWYSQATTATWACMVAISVAVDCCLYTPMSVYLRHIIIPATFMEELRRIHRRIRRRYKTVVKHAKQDVTTVGVELVQHFNPACRAARLVSTFANKGFDSGADRNTNVNNEKPCTANMSNNVTSSFIYVNDIDLPILEDVDAPLPGLWSALSRLSSKLAYTMLLPVYHLMSAAVIDLVLDYITLTVMVLMIMAVWALALVAPFLPIIVFLVILVALVIREKAIYFKLDARLHGLPIDGHAAPLLRMTLEGVEHKDHETRNEDGTVLKPRLNHDEIGVVRKALLATGEELAEMNMPNLRKPSESYSNAATTAVAPIAEEEEEEEEEVRPAQVKPAPAPAPAPTFSPAQIVPTVHIAPIVVAPAEEAPRPISPVPSPSRKREKEYVHLTNRDYLLISGTIAKHLLSKEEEAEDNGVAFRGVSTKDTIAHVLDDDVMLGMAFNSVDEDRKKAIKVISKILKKMIDKDHSVVVVPQVTDMGGSLILDDTDGNEARTNDLAKSQSMNIAMSEPEKSIAPELYIALHPSPDARQKLFDSFDSSRKRQFKPAITLAAPAATAGVVPTPTSPKAVSSASNVPPLTAVAAKTPGGGARERIQVRSKDYRMISETVLEKLRHEQDLWSSQSTGTIKLRSTFNSLCYSEGNTNNHAIIDDHTNATTNVYNIAPFPGIPTGVVVNWVVTESGGMSPDDSTDARRHKKIVTKIVSRMVHRDRTVDMVGNVPENSKIPYKSFPLDDTLLAERTGPNVSTYY